MPTLTSCPSCSKQLKVPDELIGRQVKCPACATTFTATAGTAPAEAPLPAPTAPRPEFSPSAPDREFDPGRYGEPRPPRPAGSNPLFGPGIAMLISAILNILAGGYLIANGIFVMNNKEEVIKNHPMLQNKDMKPEEREQMEQGIALAGPGCLVWGIIGLPLALLTIIGAVQMMRGKGGGLPWMAAVISVIPCTAPCCCSGIPIGIWSMIALNKVGKG
jgi:predicted Zn finger-like uncharacterized protein